MPKTVRAFLVLFAFVAGSGYLNAATTTSVTFWLCNAGKTDVDVFFSQSSQVTNKHVGSADCVTVAHKEGTMEPGLVGLAFTDVRGQWGAPRRLDLILDSDREAFDTANESTTVKRGNANVALPMKLSFHPATPTCETYTNTPMAQYPSLNPTPAQKARAESQAAAMATHETICQQLEYTLNVEAYPDTKELAFKKYCDICDKKAEATATPEEREARQRRIAAYNSINNGLVSLGGAAGAIWKNVMNLGDQALEDEAKERAAELAPPMRINWNDMTMYLYLAYRQDSRMKPFSRSPRATQVIKFTTCTSPTTPSISLRSARRAPTFFRMRSVPTSHQKWSAKIWKWKVTSRKAVVLTGEFRSLSPANCT